MNTKNQITSSYPQVISEELSNLDMDMTIYRMVGETLSKLLII